MISARFTYDGGHFSDRYTEQLGGGGGAAGAEPPRTADEAWRALPKVELFARELRPSWHAFGDEVLKYAARDRGLLMISASFTDGGGHSFG